MIQKIKKNWDVIFINFLFLGLGIGLFYWSNKIEVFAATIATGISLSIAFMQSKIQDDRIFRELFTEFNSIYETDFRKQLDEIVKKGNSDEAVLSTTDRELVIKYFNLCAEEYLWRRKYRVPNSVWDAWESGMVYYFNKPIINSILLEEKEEFGSYYGLFTYLKKKVHNL